MRLAALALGVVALLVAGVVRAAPTAAGGGYQPPVAAPVSDPFRPPAQAYGPGNRGLDYATAPGTEVKAAAPGEVVFAGQVGGTLHVVVLHADGVRTSYSFLARIEVHRGDRVDAGRLVGVAGGPVHFGARAGAAYLDPAALFGGPPGVHLVPERQRRRLPVAEERRALERLLRVVPRVARA